MTEQIRVLAVAFEPYDSQAMLRVLARLRDRGEADAVMLAIGDLWQVYREVPRSDLASLSQHLSVRYVSLERLSANWQRRQLRVRDPAHELLTLREEFRQSLRLLERSDHIFSHYERRPYYRRLTLNERQSILSDVLSETVKIFNDFRPNLVIMVDCNYLLKNAAASLAGSRGIPVRYLAFSRLDSTWYWSESFLRKPLQNDVNLTNKTQRSSGSYSRRDYGELPKNGPLYSGLTDETVLDLQAWRRVPLRTLGRGLYGYLRLLLGRAKRGLIGGELARGLPYRKLVYRSSSIKVVFGYSLLSLLRCFRYGIAGLYGAIDSVPSDIDYLYLPLHARPESSTLTYGMGTDDDEVVDFVTERLPPGVSLVVKENPLMVQLRPRKFHKRLARKPRVYLVDPLVDSQELIHESSGVVGVSGTALLEAMKQGVPAHAFGRPPFSQALRSLGFDSFEAFVEAVVERRSPTADEECLQRYEAYAASVRDSGIEMRYDWSLMKDPILMDRTVCLIADSLSSHMTPLVHRDEDGL